MALKRVHISKGPSPDRLGFQRTYCGLFAMKSLTEWITNDRTHPDICQRCLLLAPVKELPLPVPEKSTPPPLPQEHRTMVSADHVKFLLRAAEKGEKFDIRNGDQWTPSVRPLDKIMLDTPIPRIRVHRKTLIETHRPWSREEIPLGGVVRIRPEAARSPDYSYLLEATTMILGTYISFQEGTTCVFLGIPTWANKTLTVESLLTDWEWLSDGSEAGACPCGVVRHAGSWVVCSKCRKSSSDYMGRPPVCAGCLSSGGVL